MKTRRLPVAVILCLYLAALNTSWLDGAETDVASGKPYNTLYLNQSLGANQADKQSLRSSDSRHQFDIRESKGKHSLALRNLKYRTPVCWKAATIEDSGTTKLVLLKNGNLVFQDSAGTIKWESGTSDMGITRLTLGEDGSLALHAKDTMVRSLYSVTSQNPGALSADEQKGGVDLDCCSRFTGLFRELVGTRLYVR